MRRQGKHTRSRQSLRRPVSQKWATPFSAKSALVILKGGFWGTQFWIDGITWQWGEMHFRKTKLSLNFPFLSTGHNMISNVELSLSTLGPIFSTFSLSSISAFRRGGLFQSVKCFEFFNNSSVYELRDNVFQKKKHVVKSFAECDTSQRIC